MLYINLIFNVDKQVSSGARQRDEKGTLTVPTPSPRYTVSRNVLNLGTQKWRHKRSINQ